MEDTFVEGSYPSTSVSQRPAASVVSVLISAPQQAPDCQSIRWSSIAAPAALTNFWSDDYLLVDSGALCNVCPTTHMAEVPLLQLTGSAPMLRAVAGALLKIHGTQP